MSRVWCEALGLLEGECPGRNDECLWCREVRNEE